MTRAQIQSHDSTSVSLLKRLRQPANKIAWDRFVRLYTPLLVGWAHKTGLADADAADLVQEVFCVLLRKLPEFEYDPDKSFRAWLRVVLRNTWQNRRRQRIDEPRSDLNLDRPGEAHADGIVELEEAEYRQYLVARAVELMKTEFELATWQACWQTAVMDRPAAEVARELGLSVNAVYLNKSRVLARLRRELDGLLD